MKKISRACLVAAGLALAHLPIAAAENARLRYLAAAYTDANGAGLNLPEGIACGANGQIVVGDTGNNRLVRFTYRDKTLSTGTEIKIPQLTSPARVQLNSKGDIYALDTTQRRIVHLGSGGDFKETLAFAGIPGSGTVVPKSFALDGADNVYVLDVFSRRVLILSAQAQFQKALALPVDLGFGSDVAVDSTGNVLVLDSINRRLYAAGKDAGTFTQLGKDLNGILATMPTSVTTSKGVLFLLEGSGSTVVTLGRDGSFLSRQLTPGWEEGLLNHPSQMCINASDEAFIADRDNSRVQVFQVMR